MALKRIQKVSVFFAVFSFLSSGCFYSIKNLCERVLKCGRVLFCVCVKLRFFFNLTEWEAAK